MKDKKGKGEMMKEKIRIRVKKIKEKLIEIFAAYRISLILLAMWTMISIATELFAGCREIGMDAICLFLLVFAISVFWGEIWLQGRKNKKIIFCIVTGTISGLFALHTYDYFVLTERMDEYLIGYIILLLILIFYYSYRKSGESFSEYIGNTWFNGIVVLCLYLGFLLGFLFLFGMMEALFFIKIINYAMIAITIVLTGMFLFPGCMWAVTDKKRPMGTVVQTLGFGYIITIFYVLALIVGYVYMFRILLQMQMPSNEVFTVVAVLFVISIQQWVTQESYNEHPSYMKFLSCLPYFFAPLICLQIYSVGLRIGEYGLTPDRYMGIMLIIFEIITVILWKIKREKLDILLPVMAVMVIVSTIVPIINMYSMSARSQESFLIKYGPKAVDGEALGELEYNRLQGAYRYLKRNEDINGFEDKYGYLTEIIETESHANKKIRHSVHGCQMVGTLDTVDYRKMHMLNQSDEYDFLGYEKDSEVDFSKFKLYIRETGEEVTVNLSDFFEKAMEYDLENPDRDSEEDSMYLREFNCVTVNETRIFYVNHFRVIYYMLENDIENQVKITEVEISGMLLEK
ncbi:MAG: DUF4153 domain-containing protein [Lachnospiraceae bacterium]|nr:DUF4153 domain-containing protein [Lachnospiraceae bacterium]